MNIETLMQYNTEVAAWGMTFTLFELLFAFSYGAIGGVTSWLLHRNRGEVRIGKPIPTSEPWRLRYKVTRHVPFHVHLLTCATWPAVLAFCLLVWTLAAIDWTARGAFKLVRRSLGVVGWPFAVFRDGLRFRRQAAGGSREEKPGVIQDMLAYLYDCPSEWDEDEHRLGPNVAAEDIRRGQLLFVTKDGVRGVPAGDHQPPATSHQPLARRATVAEDEVMEAPAPVREGAAPYGSKLPERPLPDADLLPSDKQWMLLENTVSVEPTRTQGVIRVGDRDMAGPMGPQQYVVWRKALYQEAPPFVVMRDATEDEIRRLTIDKTEKPLKIEDFTVFKPKPARDCNGQRIEIGATCIKARAVKHEVVRVLDNRVDRCGQIEVVGDAADSKPYWIEPYKLEVAFQFKPDAAKARKETEMDARIRRALARGFFGYPPFGKPPKIDN